jgi:hypothetical protein
MALLHIIENSNGTSVSLSTILRSSYILLQSKKKKILDCAELRISISIFFTGERKNKASGYGNQNVLYKCLNKIDQNLKKRFINILSNFGISKCSNNAVYYITGIYTLDNFVIQNDVILCNTISINIFLYNIVELFYYLKDKKIDIKHYKLLLNIISDGNPIEIIWDVEKTIDNIHDKIKKKYYVNLKLTDKLLQIIL